MIFAGSVPYGAPRKLTLPAHLASAMSPHRTSGPQAVHAPDWSRDSWTVLSMHSCSFLVSPMRQRRVSHSLASAAAADCAVSWPLDAPRPLAHVGAGVCRCVPLGTTRATVAVPRRPPRVARLSMPVYCSTRFGRYHRSLAPRWRFVCPALTHPGASAAAPLEWYRALPPTARAARFAC